MRKIIIAGNWKMNKTFQETEEFLLELTDFLDEVELNNIEVAICPPALYLEMATDIAFESKFSIGSQNISVHEFGAFTGEISASMLKSMDVEYCIIGHSERRKYFNETNEMINTKLKILRRNKVIPIVCIGETLQEREMGVAKKIITHQLEEVFKDIKINGNIIIAYEPIWAIGTGKTATPQQAQEIHQFIRKWLTNNYSKRIAENLPILYGGSAKPQNINDLLEQPDIDGGLIGGASLDIEKFSEMIEIAARN